MAGRADAAAPGRNGLRAAPVACKLLLLRLLLLLLLLLLRRHLHAEVAHRNGARLRNIPDERTHADDEMSNPR